MLRTPFTKPKVSLAEAVEAAQEVVDYIPEADESITATVIKKVLKNFIADLKDNPSRSAKSELEKLTSYEKAILDKERQLKEYKSKLKLKKEELELNIQLKRIGGAAYNAERVLLLSQIDKDLSLLSPSKKDEEKKITALNKDKATLQAKIIQVDETLASIGGILTEGQAKGLILNKLFDLIHIELMRYLNAEKRRLIQAVEHLWDKYAVSKIELEEKREELLGQLDEFLKALGYLV